MALRNGYDYPYLFPEVYIWLEENRDGSTNDLKQYLSGEGIEFTDDELQLAIKDHSETSAVQQRSEPDDVSYTPIGLILKIAESSVMPCIYGHRRYDERG